MSAPGPWTWVRAAINIAMMVCLLMAGYSFADPMGHRLPAYLLLGLGVVLNVGLHAALWLEAAMGYRRRRP